GHEHGVSKQPDARRDAILDLVLVRVGAFEQPHAGDGGQEPRQFRDFRHVRLSVERGLGRIEAEGQVIEGDVADVVAENVAGRPGLERFVLRGSPGFGCLGLLQCGEGVVIGYEVERFAAMLQFDVLANGAEVVPEVQLAGRLHAAQDPLRLVHNGIRAFHRCRFEVRLRAVRGPTNSGTGMDAAPPPHSDMPAPPTATVTAAGEHRLFRFGRLAGLFPSRAGLSAEAAGQALRMGLLETVRSETRGKLVVEWVQATSRAVAYVHEHDSPKSVLRELKELLQAGRDGVPQWMNETRAELADLSYRFTARATALLKR